MSIADSLISLKNTKAAIKAAIIAKGVAVADTDAFATYPSKIGKITSGGGGSNDINTPTIVQHGMSIGQDIPVTLATAPTVGNILLAFIGHWNNGFTPNTGWYVIAQNSSAQKDIACICAKIVTAADTINVTPQGNINGPLAVFELSGLSIGAVIDSYVLAQDVTTQAVSGSWNTVLSNAGLKSTKNSGLIIGMFSFYSGTTKPTLSGDNIQEVDSLITYSRSAISFKDVYTSQMSIALTATTADTGAVGLMTGIAIPDISI